jgi:hypothetical protein
MMLYAMHFSLATARHPCRSSATLILDEAGQNDTLIRARFGRAFDLADASVRLKQFEMMLEQAYLIISRNRPNAAPFLFVETNVRNSDG